MALSRRKLLVGGALGVAAVAAPKVACSPTRSTSSQAVQLAEADFVEFYGTHQTGILHEASVSSLACGFTTTCRDRQELVTLFQSLTEQTQQLMAGTPPQVRDARYPPVDSGVVGPEPTPDNLSIVVGVGSSLFDDRFGLADQKPTELVSMPYFPNDLIDKERSHGDIVIIISANHPDTVQFALRQIMRATRAWLVLKWDVQGYARGTGHEPGAPRNLMGFKDGTANLDAQDRDLMQDVVWVDSRDDEPAWTVGGSYLVFRQIRMFVEFWDRTPLVEQEAIMGRHKSSGAPLGQEHEDDEPNLAGNAIGVDAHIRLANPRKEDKDNNLILRRGFHYTRGFDRAGRLDQGLAFVSYQRSLKNGFEAVQKRLNGEPLEEYISTEGGGYFFALPGVESANSFLGKDLLL